jgi:hypothetical protein
VPGADAWRDDAHSPQAISARSAGILPAILSAHTESQERQQDAGATHQCLRTCEAVFRHSNSAQRTTPGVHAWYEAAHKSRGAVRPWFVAPASCRRFCPRTPEVKNASRMLALHTNACAHARRYFAIRTRRSGLHRVHMRGELPPMNLARHSPRILWSAAACRRCFRARLASPDPARPRRLRPHPGWRRCLRLARDCSTSRQDGTAYSGGKPPHSIYAEPTAERTRWPASRQASSPRYPQIYR